MEWERNQNQNHIQWNLYSRKNPTREKLRVNNFIFYGTFGRINKRKCFQIHCPLLFALCTAAVMEKWHFWILLGNFFLLYCGFITVPTHFPFPLTLSPWLRVAFILGWMKNSWFLQIFIPHSQSSCVAGIQDDVEHGRTFYFSCLTHASLAFAMGHIVNQ